MITTIPTMMETIGNTYMAKENIALSSSYDLDYLDSGANTRETSFQSFVRKWTTQNAI
jgi:hypothetical protein